MLDILVLDFEFRIVNLRFQISDFKYQICQFRFASGTDFDDLAFKYLERFLNERVVLEIVFAKGNRFQFLFDWR